MRKITIIALVILLSYSVMTGCTKEQEPQGSDALVGTITEQRDLTKEEMTIFEETVPAADQEIYIPLKVATQDVEGTIYIFYCSVMENGEDTETFAYLHIFQPLEEGFSPQLFEIVPIE